VGHQDYVEVDTTTIELEPGDRFMLCSDGLHGYLNDGELERMIDGPREEVVKRLIDLANSRGGRDNITVVVVDVQDK
jgi:protein phosphatase